VLPPGEFSGTILEPLPICFDSFVTIVLTIFKHHNGMTDVVTKKQTQERQKNTFRLSLCEVKTANSHADFILGLLKQSVIFVFKLLYGVWF